jgi:hypothetical protein
MIQDKFYKFGKMLMYQVTIKDLMTKIRYLGILLILPLLTVTMVSLYYTSKNVKIACKM